MHKSIVLFSLVTVAACGSTPPRVERAESMMARGDYAAAERAADDGLSRVPDDARLWRLKMDAVQRQGEHARAAGLYFEWHRLRRHYDNRAIRMLAVGALRSATEDPEPSARIRAISAVARFRLDALRGAVEARLDDPQPTVRARAAGALLARGRWASARAREVARAVFASGDAGARAVAVRALAGAGERSVITTALADDDPRVRRAAVQQLARRGDVDRLLAAAADPDGTVRADALQGLARRGGKRAVELALAALDDDYLGARLAAIAVLAGADRRGGDALQAIVGSSDAYVALRAAVALRKRGAAVPPDVVDRAYGDRRWNVRAAALNAVLQVSSRDDAMRVVRSGLLDDRLEVRLAAARVLVRLGETGRASRTFYSALEAPDGAARVQAAVALLRLGDDGAITALDKLLSNPDPGTRAAAAFALSQTDRVSLPLVRALGDTDAAVRIAAAEALLELTK